MEDLLNKKINFGSNDIIFMEGFITEIDESEGWVVIVMSLKIKEKIEDGHFVSVTKEQFNEIVEKRELFWIAKDGAHTYIKIENK